MATRDEKKELERQARVLGKFRASEAWLILTNNLSSKIEDSRDALEGLGPSMDQLRYEQGYVRGLRTALYAMMQPGDKPGGDESLIAEIENELSRDDFESHTGLGGEFGGDLQEYDRQKAAYLGEGDFDLDPDEELITEIGEDPSDEPIITTDTDIEE